MREGILGMCCGERKERAEGGGILEDIVYV